MPAGHNGVRLKGDHTKGVFMDIATMMAQIRKHPDFDKIGMILCHNGIVRATSRDGKPVTGLRVQVDYDRLEDVIATHKKRKGIIDIRFEIVDEKDLTVGDDVMLLLVAGDIRDRVIPVLQDTLNDIKSTVTHKTEFFK